MAELLACLAHRRRVDEGQVLFNVLHHKLEVQRFVVCMNAFEHKVLVQRRAGICDHLGQTLDLLAEGGNSRGQQSAQAVAVTLFFSEHRPAVKPGIAQQLHAAQLIVLIAHLQASFEVDFALEIGNPGKARSRGFMTAIFAL